MSQAPAYVEAGPPQPAKPRRTKLFIVPVIVLLLLAIPGGAFAVAENQLGEAQRLEGQGDFAGAISRYETVQSIAGNPVSRLLMRDTADRAQAGTAETRYAWGVQAQKQNHFTDAEAEFGAAVASGLPEWQTRANAALAGLYLAWGDSLVQSKKFSNGIDKYHLIAGVDTPGNFRTQTTAALALAYGAYAQSYANDKDYPNAITWYKDLIKNFPDRPGAKQAGASALPDALYNGALAYVQQQRYQQARDAMTEILTSYASSAAGPKAAAAMKAPQPLTGILETGGNTPQPIPNRLLRISTRWRIVAPHTYDDYGGTIYSAVTDAQGNFSLMVPPGEHYLVTWWDPSRGTFVTTFINDTVPVNQVTIQPLQAEHATVQTS